MDPYRTALLDWLACACAGREQPAARAVEADGPLERVLRAGAAGHALDFDDTYLPGLAHLSAPTAPAALVVAAEAGASLADALAAFAAGFEAMGALARAAHPALYDGGWHATAVCGVVGAATAAARLLGLDPEGERTAVRLALLGAGGLRAAFGSDGKPLQVGMAAASGVRAARLAAAGARTGDTARGPAGFEEAFGARFAETGDGARAAIDDNWIKPYPCCLKAHSAIEAAAAAAGADGELVVRVHPRARQAARYDAVETGLEAKFSIPYLVAYTLLHGPPREPAAFAAVDRRAQALAAARVRVLTDPVLGEAEAVLESDGAELARVRAARGSPENPLAPAQLAEKVRRLSGGRLAGVLDDPSRPAAEALAAAGL